MREAFKARGWDAWSCDTLPTEIPGQHLQGDIRDFLHGDWGLGLFHPPCTYLANSGAKHLYLGMKKEGGINPVRWAAMEDGAAFFLELWNAPIPHIAIENPIMHSHGAKLIGMRPTCFVQPYEHGHPETKATGLYLKNLPAIVPSNPVAGREPKVHMMAPSPDRWKNRSRTFAGIAAACAAQWTAFFDKTYPDTK